VSHSRESLSQTFSIGLGEASVGWQRQQANPAVSGRQVIGHIAMEMHGPIIQGDINHIGVRILLLDEVKKAVHLFDVEVIALANYDRPTGDIHAASQAAGLSSCSAGFGPLARAGLIAASHHRATEEGELILIEEDHLFGSTVSQDAGIANISHLLIIERIRGMDMSPSPDVSHVQAL
jgi:hypothetical protein